VALPDQIAHVKGYLMKLVWTAVLFYM